MAAPASVGNGLVGMAGNDCRIPQSREGAQRRKCGKAQGGGSLPAPAPASMCTSRENVAGDSDAGRGFEVQEE